MANIILPPDWAIPERDATSEALHEQWVTRRFSLKLFGLGAFLAAGYLSGCSVSVDEEDFEKNPKNFDFSETDQAVYPATQNSSFTLDRPLTAERIAARYNNFYEFSEAKDDIWRRVRRFKVRPWTLEVSGLVKKPKVWDVDQLLHIMPLEERLYRLRCVEAWAMAVPWTGFPLQALIKQAEPLSSARFIRLTSFHSPAVAMGQRGYGPWPYTEGLSIEEAMNELVMLVTGIYGHPLPKQHGAPIRLIVPWKYGFKSIKSIVSMEFVAECPATFWNVMIPHEYGFIANVNPDVPHPRWSQRTERMIGTDQRMPTFYLNGYEKLADGLYA